MISYDDCDAYGRWVLNLINYYDTVFVIFLSLSFKTEGIMLILL